MQAVVSTMPKNLKHIVGPSTFSALIETPITWQGDIILDKVRWQMLESTGPTIKNCPNSADNDGVCSNYLAVSNVSHLPVD